MFNAIFSNFILGRQHCLTENKACLIWWKILGNGLYSHWVVLAHCLDSVTKLNWLGMESGIFLPLLHQCYDDACLPRAWCFHLSSRDRSTCKSITELTESMNPSPSFCCVSSFLSLQFKSFKVLFYRLLGTIAAKPKNKQVLVENS